MGPTRPSYGEGPGAGRSSEPAVLTPVTGDTSGPGAGEVSSPSGTTPASGSGLPPTAEPAAAGSLYLAPGAEPVPGYRLIRRLGRGGYGEVWKAAGPGGFEVALKFVSLSGQAGPVELRSLGVIKNIRHPHLLTIFGSWELGGYLALAMELADCTLQDKFREALDRGEQGLPGPELVEALRDAARGLDYLNEARHPSAEGGEPVGIQHRDIKPHNLLLVGGCVKVADFGLARILRGTHTGHTGSLTPSFAAPEFFRNETSRHSDQYSLAVTYCNLRGGRLPFTGSIEQIITGHLMREPDLSMLPEAERPAVARALAKDPAIRWPSCTAFIEGLRPAVKAERAPVAPTELHPDATPIRPLTSATEPATAPTIARRRLAGRLVVAATLAACLVLAVLALASRDRARVTIFDPPPKPSTPFAPVEVRRFEGVDEPIACLALSPLGRRAVTGGQGGGVMLWDTDAGKAILPLGRRPDRIAALAFGPDGLHVVAASGVDPFRDADRPLRHWNLLASAEPATVDGPLHRVTALAVPDDRLVVTGGADGTLWIGPADGHATGRVLPARSGAITCLAIAPEGRLVLSGAADGSVLLWDLDRGEVMHRLEGHRSGILAVAFLPGDRAASVSAPMPFRDEPPTLRLWDLTAASEHSRTELPGDITCAAFAAGGSRLVLGGGDGAVRLWDVAPARETVRLNGHAGRVGCVAVSPDGGKALSSGTDGTLRLWQIAP